MSAPAQTTTTSLVPEADGYVVHEFVGRGASGTVWRATQEGTLREVALKFLEAWRGHELGRLRFMREAEIAAALEHEGIARVFGSGESASGPWLAMELVDGPPLDRWVTEQNPSLRERVALFSRICEAVRYAHQRGVIHRDLKPGNVLVALDGTPKVVDFGLACWSDGPSLEVTLTRQGEVFGSLAWMPPEQAAGRWAEVDALSDVYALGAILYSLLAGVPPLDAALPPAALLTAAQSGEHRGVREVNPQTPRDLAAVVEKCLAADKARRFQSAAELEADVTRWLAGEPVSARTAAPFYWIGKKLRRHWLAAAAAVTVLFSASGLAWGYLRGEQARELEKREAAQREAAQTARTLHEAQELVSQLLVEMKPKFEAAGHPEWIKEAEKRVAAFPWDIGGAGTGAWDPRRFRGRAALAQGDLLTSQAQWGGALRAYKEAIEQLETLVPEQPDVPIFREELALARIGAAMTLVRLRFPHEAFTEAETALTMLEPRSGKTVSPAVWEAMVDAACAVSQAALEANERKDTALKLLPTLTSRLPGGEDIAQMTAEQAEWRSRILYEQTRLMLSVNPDAVPAEPSAVKAVACARRAVELTGGRETHLRQLAMALTVEAGIARRLEQAPRAIDLLKEASAILMDRLGPPPLTMSAAPYGAVAEEWEQLSLYIKRLADDMKQASFYTWASDATGGAVRMWEFIRRTKKDTKSHVALSRLSLRNAQLLQLDGKAAEGVTWAARAIRIFEIAAANKSCKEPIALNAFEAAVLMCEWKSPKPDDRTQTWRKSAARAMQWLKETPRSLDLEEGQRLADLEKRLSAIMDAPDSAPAQTGVVGRTGAP